MGKYKLTFHSCMGSTRRDVKECKQQIYNTHVIMHPPIHPSALLPISGLGLPNFIRHAINIHTLYMSCPLQPFHIAVRCTFFYTDCRFPY
jgi:hypothetical protein